MSTEIKPEPNRIEVMYGSAWLGGWLADYDSDEYSLGVEIRRTKSRIWMMQNEAELAAIIANAKYDLDVHRDNVRAGYGGFAASYVAAAKSAKAKATKMLAILHKASKSGGFEAGEAGEWQEISRDRWELELPEAGRLGSIRGYVARNLERVGEFSGGIILMSQLGDGPALEGGAIWRLAIGREEMPTLADADKTKKLVREAISAAAAGNTYAHTADEHFGVHQPINLWHPRGFRYLAATELPPF